jgi:thiosulfate/3-mercaptopyruvate sulfurtransferase
MSVRNMRIVTVSVICRLRDAVCAGLIVLALFATMSCVPPEEIVAVPPTATNVYQARTATPPATREPTPEAMVFPLAAPVHVGIDSPTDEGCVDCHTDEEALKGSMEAQEQKPALQSEVEDWASELPPVEAWQLVYIDEDRFFETMHGRYGCPTCHGGEGDTKLKETAHRGMVSQPSAAGVCWDCHVEEVAGDLGSLHTNLTGYRTVLAARSTPEKMPLLEEMMGNHCEPCHTATCGQCHVSRPARLGGGLVAGHVFENTPAINLTCAGCHGSRVADEYRGHNGTVPGDVHWVQAEMLCSDCHTGREFHGQVEGYVHRYDGQPLPACTTKTCHPDVAEDDGVEQHGDDHLKLLSCQACHSTTYKNCYGCHVAVEDGRAQFRVEPPQMALKIGRNPLQDRYRPWKYVPLRHVPITPDSFSFYGEALLPEFDALPTWKYTTPHNIQRVTPQTETCNACHGNAAVFLTADDLLPNELTPNMRVIVKEIPAPVD